MPLDQDVRWHQRLANFEKALKELTDAIELSKKRALSKLEKQGLIQAFEYNYELAWNCIKDFYQTQGETDIQGSRDAFRVAFQRGLIEDGAEWMKMIQSRILSSHTYHEEMASSIVESIINNYYDKFLHLQKKLRSIQNDEPC